MDALALPLWRRHDDEAAVSTPAPWPSWKCGARHPLHPRIRCDLWHDHEDDHAGPADWWPGARVRWRQEVKGPPSLLGASLLGPP